MKSTSHSETPTTDQQQRLLRDRALVLCGQLNEREGCHAEACLVHNLVDEIDRLSPRSTHIEVMKKDAQVEMRKEIITLRKCLDIAEKQLKYLCSKSTLERIQQIKKEGGIE